MSNQGILNTKNIVTIGSMVAGGSLIAFSRPWRSPERISTLIAGGMLLYWGASRNQTLGKYLGTKAHTKSGVASVHHNRAVRIEKSIAVNGPPESLYRIWRNPENLPCFMDHVDSVRAISDSRSHWTVKGPAGKRLEWESEIYNERENESFAWHSLLNADINNAGSVHFRSLPDAGTEVRVIMSYEPPAGPLGKMIAKLSGNNPEALLERDLQRFKNAFEAGQLIPNP